jgi:methionyl-tRNA formyltransferase
MDVKDCRIVFLGTPDFAVTVLEKLVNEGCQVVGVVTAPDKPAGRGMQLSQSAVKKFAIEKGLNVLQPLKLKDPSFIDELKELKADVQVVVAFRMLPELVWNMPPMGTINLHGSLLPKYRGAAPINWAIINGEKETGVTTFKLKHEIDTGDVLMQEIIPISETMTAGELHDTMKEIGANLIYQTLDHYCSNTLMPKPQEQISQTALDEIPAAPKLHTETSRIDWNMPAKKIYDLIRGLSPYPAAFTHLDGKLLKIYKASYEIADKARAAGTYNTDGKSFLQFAAADGWVFITEMQLEGKKRMDIASFLRGHRFSN